MSTETPNLLSHILTASVELDGISRRARKLVERIARLEEGQRKSMPSFSGPWTKEAVEVHLDRLEEAARQPIRGRNRRQLETAGITGVPVGTELLDDTDAVDAIVAAFTEIITAIPKLKEHLLQEECLPVWFKKGAVEAKAKLAAVRQGQNRIQGLVDAEVPDPLRKELLRTALADPSSLKAAEQDVALLVFARQWSVSIKNNATVSALRPALVSLRAAIETIQTRFPERLDTLRTSISGTELEHANRMANSLLEGAQKEYGDALAEWQRLAPTARLLGKDVDPTPPLSLTAVRQQTQEFRQHCANQLGETGMALLQFLKGQAEFPASSSLKSVKQALLALRPFLVVKNGGTHA